MSIRELRILLPLDGSADAESVLAAVLPLAQRCPLRLTLLSVDPEAAAPRASKAYLEKARRALQGPGIETRTAVCAGDPATAIVARASATRADLIAMATHGRSGVSRLLLGSVTESVLRRTPVPLIACRPACRMEGWTHVVALDGSARAETILDDLVPLTRMLGATLHLLHVASTGLRGRSPWRNERPDLERLAAVVAARGVPVIPVIRQGQAAAEILRYAREQRAGLLAMATHGRTGLERVVLGSVAEEVLRSASCPVLLRREIPSTAPLSPDPVLA